MLDAFGNVCNFAEEHAFLSNFYPVNITMDNMCFPSVEHAYQAAKTHSTGIRLKIQQTVSAGAAKRIGQNIPRRIDWREQRVEIMRALVAQKFSQRPLLNLLVATGRRVLTEGNYWHDNFWGACTCSRCEPKVKLNQLGKMLMEIRDATGIS